MQNIQAGSASITASALSRTNKGRRVLLGWERGQGRPAERVVYRRPLKPLSPPILVGDEARSHFPSFVLDDPLSSSRPRLASQNLSMVTVRFHHSSMRPR